MTMAQSTPISQDEPKESPETIFLTLNLTDCHGAERLPFRDLILGPPYSLRIGRGSQNDPKLQPRTDNAWFASRVMSRDHALLRADPVTRRVTLEDTESLHGTFIEGKKLQPLQPEVLLQNDTITFGADIIRGDLTYEALMVGLHFQWSDGPRMPNFALARFRNTFTADYSEDDTRSDHDEDAAADSLSHTEVGLGYKPRTFSVPDSDDSDLDSDLDDDLEREGRSSPSSLMEKDETAKIQVVSTQNDAVQPQPTARASFESSGNGVPLPDEQNSADENDDHDDEQVDGFDLDQKHSDSDICGTPSDEDEEEDDDENASEDDFSDKSSVADKADVETQAPSVHTRETECEYPTHIGPFGTNLPNPGFPRYPGYTTSPVKTNFNIGNLVPQALPSTYARDFNWPVPEPFAIEYQTMPFYNNELPPIQTMSASSCARFDPQPTVYPQPVSSASALYGHYATYTDDLEGTRGRDLPSVETTQPAKVSIQDIVEPVVATQPEPTVGLKRKADESVARPDDVVPTTEATHEISSVEPATHVEDAEPTEADASEDSSVVVLEELTVKTSETIHDQVSVDAAEQTSEPEEETPRKKVKIADTRIETHSSSNTLLKYTATAFAGMAVGAISTVFGLAALPADYFN